MAGGRYRPWFRARGTTYNTSLIVFEIRGRASVEPGSSAEIEGVLLDPSGIGANLAEGLNFGLFEGDREVGEGVVLAILGDED